MSSVLAVIDNAAVAARTNPQDGQHYPAALNDGTHAIMRMRMAGLGGKARGGQQVGTCPTAADAEAECDRLNGFAEVRAAICGLLAAADAIDRRAITHGDDGLYIAGGVSVSELRALRTALAKAKP